VDGLDCAEGVNQREKGATDQPCLQATGRATG
jgi:hypothetical protein